MSDNIGFPYVTLFEKYIKDEFDLRSIRKGNTLRQKRTAWVRIISNAEADLSDITTINRTIHGLILSPNRLSFAEAYGYSGDGTVVGYEADNESFRIHSADKDRHRPPPIVDSVQVDHAGSFGSFRKATINFRVFSIDQFEIIERFFLNPGITILLEWGWDDYGGNLISPNNIDEIRTLFENSQSYLREKRKATRGRYDAMVGILTSFQYTIDEEGAFVCTSEISSQGEIYLMMKNESLQEKNPLDVVESIEVVIDTGQDDKFQLLLRELTSIGISRKALGNDIFKPVTLKSDIESGTKTISEGPAAIQEDPDQLFYISWGWIEDHLLSNIKSSDKKIVRSGSTSAGKLFASPFIIDSSNTRISGHPNLISCNPDVMLIPNINGPQFNIDGSHDPGKNGSVNDLTINGNNFPDPNDASWSGNIRNIYINSKLLINLLNQKMSMINFLKSILKQMSDASCNLWDLGLSDQFTDKNNNNVVSVIDNNYTRTAINEILKSNKLYEFKILNTKSIINSFNLQSTLPKEMGAMIIFNRAMSKNVTIGDYKDVVGAPWYAQNDRILKNFSVEDSDFTTRAGESDDNSADRTNFYKDNFVRFKKQSDVDSAVFACTHIKLMRSLLFENETNDRNNYNNNVLIPLEVSITLDGISGLIVGNSFTLDGISKQLKRFGIWQIVGITHTISDSNWSTELKCMMRVRNPKVVVKKSKISTSAASKEQTSRILKELEII